MTAASMLQLLVLAALLVGTVPLLGRYLAAVYGARPDGTAPGDRYFAPIERLVYRVLGVDPAREQRWRTYALSLLAFSAVSVVALRDACRRSVGRVQHRHQLHHQHQLAGLRR
jgi:K+-transporting ATPase ATPase A chain